MENFSFSQATLLNAITTPGAADQRRKTLAPGSRAGGGSSLDTP